MHPRPSSLPCTPTSCLSCAPAIPFINYPRPLSVALPPAINFICTHGHPAYCVLPAINLTMYSRPSSLLCTPSHQAYCVLPAIKLTMYFRPSSLLCALSLAFVPVNPAHHCTLEHKAYYIPPIIKLACATSHLLYHVTLAILTSSSQMYPDYQGYHSPPYNQVLHVPPVIF